MYVPEKLKINKFREVRIPKKREYFMTGRYIGDTGIYGGEETEVNTQGEHKVDTAQKCLEDIERFEKSEQ